MDAFAGHKASVHHKDKSNRVELQGGAREPCSQRKVLKNPPLGDEVSHNGIETKASGNRGSLKVFAFASSILGKSRDRNVEAGEASETAQNEEGQAHVVDGGTQAEGECHRGRGNAERNLCPLLAVIPLLRP